MNIVFVNTTSFAPMHVIMEEWLIHAENEIAAYVQNY